MSTLDSSMVNIALPTIMNEFQSSLRLTEWVVMIYLLTITATLLFWGHLSDRLGRAKIYPAGMLAFGLGSLACAYSATLSWLITARFCQALGAAMMMSTGPAIIKESFPVNQLGRGLGLIGVAVSLGLMSGPAIGGFILEFYSWRALFLLTVPFGLIFALLGKKFLPRPTKVSSSPKLDWLGGLSWAVALTCVSFAITHASGSTWSLPFFSLILLTGFVFFLFFAKIESLAPHPLLPLHFFQKRFFAMAALSAVLSFMTLFAVIMLIPFYLDRVLGMSSARIGLIMMAIPLAILVVAPIAGWLSDHLDPRIISTLGLSISTVGLLLLTRVQEHSSALEIAGKIALLGCGQAMFLSPNSASVLGRVKQEQAGSAAALLATARNMGMLLGIAQAGLVFSLYFAKYTDGLDMKDFAPEHVDSFVLAVRGAFQVAAATGFVGVLASSVRGRRKRLSETVDDHIRSAGPYEL